MVKCNGEIYQRLFRVGKILGTTSMNILIFCAYPVPATDSEPLFCGGQYYPFYLSKALSQLGVEIHIIARQIDRQPLLQKYQKITIHRFRSFHHIGGHRRGISFNRNRQKLVTQLCKNNNFDWIITFSPLTNELSILGKNNIKICYMAPGVNVGYLANLGLSPKDILRKLFIKYISQPFLQKNINQARKIFANCRSDKKLIQDYFCPKIPVLISSNGVDTNIYKPIPFEKKTQTIFLTVGRFSPEKGYSELLEAIHILKQQGIKPQFLFVGFEDDKKYLQKIKYQIIQLGLGEQVTVKTNIAEGLMPKIFSESTAFISYSKGYDPLPSVLFQAFASGLPVISTDWSARRGVVTEGYDGFLIPSGKKYKLVEKIKLIINNSELTKKLSYNARKTACQRYDFNNLAGDLISILKDQ